jgi:NADH:ubiquinone oxidoreductase subunit F (NADH-binding)
MASRALPHRLLAGPAAAAGAESLHAHAGRLGAWRSAPIRGAELIGELEASGLLGRGGAGFPVGCKWRALAGRSMGPAVVLANGAEGEPRSHKDRVLMAQRPHLVLDGAMLAAEAVGADEVVVYIGEEHVAATAAIRAAIAERAAAGGSDGTGDVPVRLVRAPLGYVAGEASAAVSYVNRGIARPTAPPRPSEVGIGGRPTLVQNVESLAYAALIARFGAAWYSEVGRCSARGTALVTAGVAGDRARVLEIELGITIGELAGEIGLDGSLVEAVLVGGYFGTWTAAAAAWALPLDPLAMRGDGLTFGCGMVSFLPAGRCGVAASAEVIDFMARGSARQCGPCRFGLAAIADHAADLAACRAGPAELVELQRLLGLVVGRGACHHPDGAAAVMASALAAFGEEFDRHARTGRCAAGSRASPGATDAVPGFGVADRVA